MSSARWKFLKSAGSNAAFFAIAAGVFIAFTVFYTRAYGVERYGQFSFLLNTVTALISLGAYEGFLITHSLTQSREKFDAFTNWSVYFNAGLVVVAAIAFMLATGRVDAAVIVPVVLAIYLDYRSQPAIAVLITNDDNWKVRAFRTVYQVVLLVGFFVMQQFGVAMEYAFGSSVLTAAIIHLLLLTHGARKNLDRSTEAAPGLSDASSRILLIAVSTNLATVLFLLLDKLAIRHFGIGTDFSVGLYFLFFDLATRAEAFYLFLAVPGDKLSLQ